MKTPQILLCDCYSTEHQIVIQTDTDPVDNSEAYLNIYLTPRPF